MTRNGTLVVQRSLLLRSPERYKLERRAGRVFGTNLPRAPRGLGRATFRDFDPPDSPNPEVTVMMSGSGSVSWEKLSGKDFMW